MGNALFNNSDCSCSTSSLSDASFLILSGQETRGHWNRLHETPNNFNNIKHRIKPELKRSRIQQITKIVQERVHLTLCFSITLYLRHQLDINNVFNFIVFENLRFVFRISWTSSINSYNPLAKWQSVRLPAKVVRVPFPAGTSGQHSYRAARTIELNEPVLLTAWPLIKHRKIQLEIEIDIAMQIVAVCPMRPRGRIANFSMSDLIEPHRW